MFVSTSKGIWQNQFFIPRFIAAVAGILLYLLISSSVFAEIYTQTEGKGLLRATDGPVAVKGMEIIDFGLFGMNVHNADVLTLIRKTDRIPVALSNKFGIRYKIIGTPAGGDVAITVKILTPGRKTVAGPRMGSIISEEQRTALKKIGGISCDGFVFENVWELAPGTWTVQIFFQDRMLGEKKFEVYKKDKKAVLPLPESIKEQVEKLSSDDCQKRRSAVHQMEDMEEKAAPAIPYLLQTLKYYSLPDQIAFDCGSGKAVPGALAGIGMSAVNPLIESLADKSWNVREGAKEALVKIGKKAVSPLIKALQENTDLTIRHEVAEVLGRIRDERAVIPLIEALTKDPEPAIRMKAAEMLAELKAGRAVKPLADVALDEEENLYVRYKSIEVLGKIGDEKTKKEVSLTLLHEQDTAIREALLKFFGPTEQPDEALLLGVHDKDASVRSLSLSMLVKKKHAGSAEIVSEALKDPHWAVRMTAVGLLVESGSPKADDALIGMLKDGDRNVRVAAANELGPLRSANAVQPLLELLNDKDTDLKCAVIRTLALINEERCLLAIMTAVNDNNAYVRKQATTSLGEFKDQRVVALLIDVMKGKIPGASHEAKKSLGKVGSPAVKQLIESFRGERDHGSRLDGIDALVAIGDPGVEPLIQALNDSDHYVQESAATALGSLRDDRAVLPLIETLNDHNVCSESARALGMIGKASVQPLIVRATAPDPRFRAMVVMAIGETRSKEAGPFLIKALKDQDTNVRINAAAGLGHIKDAKAVMPLIQTLQDQNSYVRNNAAEACGIIGDKQAVEPLIKLLKADSETRRHVINAVGLLKDKRATRHIIPFLKDSRQQLRLMAAQALAELGDKKAISALIESLNDSDREVKWSKANALRKITKKNFGDDQAEWMEWLKRSRSRE